ncbi:MAG: dockerin type I repeat-containing protein [Ruminococcus sp.]|nr:dockerin type I repeat-containing protein [Ruminococcus sp.]
MKKFIAVMSTIAVMCSYAPAIPENILNTSAVSVPETFFVVVGTFLDDVQLKYFGEDSTEKVVWKDAPEGLEYGDVLVADGEVSMERFQSFPDNPVYAHAYHYELAEDTVLDNIGNCSEIAEQKELTVKDKMYDGSGHYSIHLNDSEGNAYYYGFNAMGSSLGVNPLDTEDGEVCTYSFINGNIIIPLADTDIMGDANGDGVFSIADVVLIQKWLLNSSEDTITDWKKADFNEDGVLDVFDLVIMKQMIINS